MKNKILLSIKPKWFIIILIAEVLLLSLMRWPKLMSLPAFAHGDQGAVLTLHELTRQGLRPGVDFNYLYGLGTVAFGDLVFSIFGISSVVYVCTCIVLAILYAIAIGWAILAFGIHSIGCILIISGIAMGMPLPSWNFVHLIEPTLLSCGIGLYSRRCKSSALAIFTITIFFKPSLAYFCILYLIIEKIYILSSNNSRLIIIIYELILFILPSIISSIIISVILCYIYGLDALINTLFPFTAMSVYKHENFGFLFGVGREFYMPTWGANWKYYIGSGVLFWIISCIILVISCIYIIYMIAVTYRYEKIYQSILFCGVIHTIFVVLLYGNLPSYMYVYNILLIGLYAIIYNSNDRFLMLWHFFAIMALVGTYGPVKHSFLSWINWTTASGTYNLYYNNVYIDEWNRLVNISQNNRVFVLHYLGAAQIINRHLYAPSSWCLYWWCATEREKSYVIQHLRCSEVVAIPLPEGRANHSMIHPANGPPFREELRAFPIVEEWTYYRILRRSNATTKEATNVLQ